ncbi:MAG: hypothetical protein JKY31_07365 [Rhodobacteraceae bacterium]|nr:hypothetical protein [Paracoccaceae bacterium]
MSNQTSLIAQSPALNSLSQRQKAAIIVRLLVGGGTSIDSLDLDADAIWKITNTMTGLGVIDQDVVNAVTAEFIITMEKMGMVFEKDLDGSLSLLSDQMDPKVLGQVKDRQHGSAEETAWREISRTDSDRLALLIERENPRIGAIILSKLSAAKSAEIVGQIDGEAARAILGCITKISEVDTEVVNQIGIALAASLTENSDDGAFKDSAEERIGAILNVSQSAFRDQMLENFEKDDPAAAESIRKLMFTFEDIPTRIVGRDISKILRGVEDSTLVAALSGAAETMPEVKEFIMSNISSRLAEQIEENIKDNGPVKPRDADAAMTQMVIALKELEKSGDIKLIEIEEEEEE